MIKKYKFSGNVRDDIVEKYGFDGDLLELFVGNEGPIVHKWHHYIPIYERYFAPFRATDFKFLEIGVNKGGSLQMWRKYFGTKATICSIDINPDCAQFDGQAGMVRIGSQDDPDFLRDVVAEMGGLDLVLDDGSHHMTHITKTLDILYPLLSTPGIYMVEDLHTAYWPKFGGGPGEENFFNYLTKRMHDMHHWYSGQAAERPDLAQSFSCLHVHDSIAVIEKAQVFSPVHSKIGTPA
ncbi:MAG: class I SAM-dependent methyltransferase [Pseudomonadota bacterium]